MIDLFSFAEHDHFTKVSTDRNENTNMETFDRQFSSYVLYGITIWWNISPEQFELNRAMLEFSFRFSFMLDSVCRDYKAHFFSENEKVI